MQYSNIELFTATNQNYSFLGGLGLAKCRQISTKSAQVI